MSNILKLRKILFLSLNSMRSSFISYITNRSLLSLNLLVTILIKTDVSMVMMFNSLALCINTWNTLVIYLLKTTDCLCCRIEDIGSWNDTCAENCPRHRKLELFFLIIGFVGALGCRRWLSLWIRSIQFCICY